MGYYVRQLKLKFTSSSVAGWNCAETLRVGVEFLKLWMNLQCSLPTDLLCFLAFNAAVYLLSPLKLVKSVTLKVSKDHSLQRLRVLSTLIIGITFKASDCIHSRGGGEIIPHYIYLKNLGISCFKLFFCFLKNWSLLVG